MIFTVCGKGGSGKSTVTTLLSREFAAGGYRVLVVDCDESNYGLHQQLGMELPKSFTDYFGGKVKVMELLGEGPENMPMLFDRSWTLDDIPSEYYAERNGIRLMTPGKIESANEACACPFNLVMLQLMSVLELGERDVVIMDMEAGIEHFGRGTDNITDCVLMVIDPSYESIKLSEKIGDICQQMGKPIFYVLNRVTYESRDALHIGISNIDRVCCELPMSREIMFAGLSGAELTVQTAAVREMRGFLEERLSPAAV